MVGKKSLVRKQSMFLKLPRKRVVDTKIFSYTKWRNTLSLTNSEKFILCHFKAFPDKIDKTEQCTIEYVKELREDQTHG